MTPSALPGPVRDLAQRLGVPPDTSCASARLTQEGRIKRKLGADSWMSFTATQTIATDACRFDWRARAGPLGMITAHDALLEQAGQFDILALGIIPIARAAHTPALMRGELMRYLAEIAMAPDAILRNPALRWRVQDASTLAVSAGTGPATAEILLSLDRDGRIAGAYAPDRPRAASPPILPTPWRGRFSDYRQHAGRWLPFAGEVAWEIDGAHEVYWQGRILQWQTG